MTSAPVVNVLGEWLLRISSGTVGVYIFVAAKKEPTSSGQCPWIDRRTGPIDFLFPAHCKVGIFDPPRREWLSFQIAAGRNRLRCRLSRMVVNPAFRRTWPLCKPGGGPRKAVDSFQITLLRMAPCREFSWKVMWVCASIKPGHHPILWKDQRPEASFGTAMPEPTAVILPFSTRMI